jgi:hypothetical protein
MAEQVGQIQVTAQERSAVRSRAWREPLPEVRVPILPEEVIRRLEKRSQRGELPGFRALGAQEGTMRVEVSAFGSHVDRVLAAQVAATEGGAIVTFQGRRIWKVLWIVIIVFVLTLWPGVWLTHSMLITWFSWYRLNMWGTTAWYVPLTLIAIPGLLKALRASEQASWAHAHETIANIARTCDGAVAPPPPA